MCTEIVLDLGTGQVIRTMVELTFLLTREEAMKDTAKTIQGKDHTKEKVHPLETIASHFHVLVS
jgi:hypothetical protein